jgi:hypothetical protein
MGTNGANLLIGAGLHRQAYCGMTRDELIAWLARIDPNGVWSDEDSAAEGMPMMTIEGARNALTALVSRD